MKKKVFLFAILTSFLFLCGCGVTLRGSVKLNKDFSGTRVMSCTFSSRDFKTYFNGNKEDLNNLIQKSCPDALTYDSSSKDGNDTYTFYLRFSSLDDYKKKVNGLLNFSPKITYEYGDSPFVNGLIYKENFTSKDLMTWLYTALYEGKYIDKDSSNDLWNLKTTEISFLGKTYETNDKINIDEMNYVSLSSIDIDTNTLDSGKLQRTIRFHIPQKVLDQNSGKIRSYFAGNDITWENTSDGKNLCISFDANNFSDLAQKTRSILHSKNSFGTYTTTCNKKNPFELKIEYKESLDMSNFVKKSGNISVTYTFDGKEILNESVKQKEISFPATLKQPISKYEIATVWNRTNDIRRKISFTFQPNITNRQLSVLKKQFHGSTIGNVSVNGNKTVTLSFVQTGNVSECNKDFKALFPDSSMKSSEHFSLSGGKKIEFVDSISLPFDQKDVSGSYIFASVNPEESVSVGIAPDDIVKGSSTSNTATKMISDLVHSDETVHDLCKFSFTGDHLKLTYKGSTTSSFWLNVIKWVLPIVFLLVIGIFLFQKKQVILENLRKLKIYLSKKINDFIDKINQL